MQADHGLARAGPAPDARRPVERAAHERGLRRVQERHPVLDRGREVCLSERLAHLLLAQEGTVVEKIIREGVGELVEHRFGDREDWRVDLCAGIGREVLHSWLPPTPARPGWW